MAPTAPLARVRRLCRRYQDADFQVHLLREPVIAFGQCGWVSEGLVREARRLFMAAHLVLLEEPDDWMKARPLPVDDVGIGFSLTHHAVACVGGWYVDYTARQFDPKAAFPLITADRETVITHWRRVTEPAPLDRDGAPPAGAGAGDAESAEEEGSAR